MFDSEHDGIAEDHVSYTLHPLRGMVWAAFWGTPVAAGLVMAINYSRVGNKSAARNSVVIGVLASVALFAIIFAIPDDISDSIPDAVFYIPQLVIVQLIATSLQSELIAAHEAKGGAVASAWPSVGIGALCLPFVVGAIFGIAYLTEPSFGTVVTFGNDEVYYSGDATEADARKLAGVLKDIEFFGAGGGASVKIQASSGQYSVSFILVQNAWEDQETNRVFNEIGGILTESAFSRPLEIHLCDEYFTTKRTLTIR